MIMTLKDLLMVADNWLCLTVHSMTTGESITGEYNTVYHSDFISLDSQVTRFFPVPVIGGDAEDLGLYVEVDGVLFP